MKLLSWDFLSCKVCKRKVFQYMNVIQSTRFKLKILFNPYIDFYCPILCVYIHTYICGLKVINYSLYYEVNIFIFVFCYRAASNGILIVLSSLTFSRKIGSALCAMENLCGSCVLSVQMLSHFLRRFGGI